MNIFKKNKGIKLLLIAIYPVTALALLILNSSNSSGNKSLMGFEIGNSKIEAFEHSSSLFEKGLIQTIGTRSQTNDFFIECPDVYKTKELAVNKTKILKSDSWNIEINLNTKVNINLEFTNNNLDLIVIDEKSSSKFVNETNIYGEVLSKGQNKNEIFKKLLSANSNLLNGNSLNITVDYNTKKKDFLFSPQYFAILNKRDYWRVFLDKTANNYIDLKFKENKVSSVNRDLKVIQKPGKCLF